MSSHYQAPRFALASLDVLEEHGLRLCFVEARGEVDASNAPEFERAVLDVMRDRLVILDLSAVEYFDSAGFAVLNRLTADGRLKVVLDETSALRRATTVMSISFHDDRDAALTAFIDKNG